MTELVQFVQVIDGPMCPIDGMPQTKANAVEQTIAITGDLSDLGALIDGVGGPQPYLWLPFARNTCVQLFQKAVGVDLGRCIPRREETAFGIPPTAAGTTTAGAAREGGPRQRGGSRRRRTRRSSGRRRGRFAATNPAAARQRRHQQERHQQQRADAMPFHHDFTALIIHNQPHVTTPTSNS